jgi:hypothetical protein
VLLSRPGRQRTNSLFREERVRVSYSTHLSNPRLDIKCSESLRGACRRTRRGSVHCHQAPLLMDVWSLFEAHVTPEGITSQRSAKNTSRHM